MSNTAATEFAQAIFEQAYTGLPRGVLKVVMYCEFCEAQTEAMPKEEYYALARQSDFSLVKHREDCIVPKAEAWLAEFQQASIRPTDESEWPYE